MSSGGCYTIGSQFLKKRKTPGRRMCGKQGRSAPAVDGASQDTHIDGNAKHGSNPRRMLLAVPFGNGAGDGSQLLDGRLVHVAL